MELRKALRQGLILVDLEAKDYSQVGFNLVLMKKIDGCCIPYYYSASRSRRSPPTSW